MTKELSRKELDRQDFVDNEIAKLITKLNPNEDENIDWIKSSPTIANIRNEICHHHVHDLQSCTEEEFYPFIEEDEEMDENLKKFMSAEDDYDDEDDDDFDEDDMDDLDDLEDDDIVEDDYDEDDYDDEDDPILEELDEKEWR